MIETIARERRVFLGAALSSGLFGLSTSAQAKIAPERSLSLYNQHTGETLYSVFWYKGNYQADSLKEINHLFRDHRSNSSHPIDPHLLDVLHQISQASASYKPIEIISAYRSPRTNKALRKRSTGVAKNSYHLKGKAVDIKIANRSSKQLYKIATDLKAGGVGYYPRSGFVHIDTGPVRNW